MRAPEDTCLTVVSFTILNLQFMMSVQIWVSNQTQMLGSLLILMLVCKCGMRPITYALPGWRMLTSHMVGTYLVHLK
jgi:hypothetical protein